MLASADVNRVGRCLAVAALLFTCGCRALGEHFRDHGPCIFCRTPVDREAFRKEIAKDPKEYPYNWGYMYPPIL